MALYSGKLLKKKWKKIKSRPARLNYSEGETKLIVLLAMEPNNNVLALLNAME